MRRPALLASLLLLVCAAPARAASDALVFLGGAAAGLVAHESGHVVLDLAFDAHPGIKHVDFAGIPFFAITHDTVTPRKEFMISSAGFWVQHATSEVFLSRQPPLRSRHSPFEKGFLAFNVLTSVAYAGAAFAQTGPAERDTHGMATSLRVSEPWIGAMLLVPAGLDGYRYFHPESKWAAWTSRAAKVALVVLLVKAPSSSSRTPGRP
jgi:hypothetical protein